MNAIIQNFQGHNVRIAGTPEEPLFVAQDVCDILEISEARSSTRDFDEDEKGVHSMHTPGGTQSILCVTESGLYKLIFKSRKPEAKAFQKWVTKEVLPAIRKTGGYGSNQDPLAVLNDPAAMRGLLLTYSEKVLALEAKTAEDAPKVEFYDTVTESNHVCQMAVAAQVAKLPFGRNTLFQKLRGAGVLISGGERHNMPKQSYIEQGLFTVNQRKFENPETGEPIISFTTYVTQKGIDWIIRKFGKSNAA